MATGLLGRGGGLSSSTISGFGGAAADLFTSFGDESKAAGDFAEARSYMLASELATKNEKYTETSTAIKLAQQQREMTTTMGGTQADIASAGFSEGGSALDILRDSASQGALTHAVLGQQGLITEAGYHEQAASFKNMADAATMAGDAAHDAAGFAKITGAIKGIAAIATLV